MRAAREFVLDLDGRGLLQQVVRVEVALFGSLALTGRGHGTDSAVLLGLMAEQPDRVDPDSVAGKIRQLRSDKRLALCNSREIDFDEATDLQYHRDQLLPRHSNGMRFTAYAADGETLLGDEFYSIGGGFVIRGEESTSAPGAVKVPYPFTNAADLLGLSERHSLSFDDLVLANEQTWRSADQVRDGLLEIWSVMQACVARGLIQSGELPGGLGVKRRAPGLYRDIIQREGTSPLEAMDWANVWALAVNEENAAGGRVVTAPTNGAAGIIPSVLHFYSQFTDAPDDAGVLRFLLTAGAIGILYKKNASISGAEMGCQGEVGVACSMAAAGLVGAMSGSPAQVENAAEIGMEHNLGLTCDPVGGLVQIPCIERNAMGAVKAINAALMSMCGDGQHRVTLDQVIATMRQTGTDMSTIYKETSEGGLAVNVPEC